MTSTAQKPVYPGPCPFPKSPDAKPVHFPTSAEKDKPHDSPQAEGQGKQDDDKLSQAELSAEELRLMADTMPGDSPGD